jgi:hypothetical protein
VGWQQYVVADALLPTGAQAIVDPGARVGVAFPGQSY